MVTQSVTVEKDVLASVLEKATKTKILLQHQIGEYVYTVLRQEQNDELKIVVYRTDLSTNKVKILNLRCDLRMSKWCPGELKLAEEIGLTQEMIDRELGIDSALIDKATKENVLVAWVYEVRRIHTDIAVIYRLGYANEESNEIVYVLRYQDMEYRLEVDDDYHSVHEVADLLCKMVELGVRAGIVKSLK